MSYPGYVVVYLTALSVYCAFAAAKIMAKKRGVYLSMNNTISIREFSKHFGIMSSTLRYWDEIGIFSPQIRDPENNYRLYSASQLPKLNFITTLSALEVPLKQIAELQEKRDPERVLGILDKLEKVVNLEMHELLQRHSVIHTRRELINAGLKADVNSVAVVKLEESRMKVWPRNEYKEGDTLFSPLANHFKSAKDRHIDPSLPIGGRHDSFKSFKREPSFPNHFVTIDPYGSHIRKAGEYLVAYCRGYYGELGDVVERMEKYAGNNGLRFAGCVYTSYLHGEFATSDPSKYLAQICVAVTPMSKR